MQVMSKDSKHLFSLDNLFDFLHKKADITDRLSNIASCEESMTPAYNENEVRKEKHGWRWDRYKQRL